MLLRELLACDLQARGVGDCERRLLAATLFAVAARSRLPVSSAALSSAAVAFAAGHSVGCCEEKLERIVYSARDGDLADIDCKKAL